MFFYCAFLFKKIALFWLLMYPTIKLKLHLKVIIVMVPVGCSHSHGGCSGGKQSCHGGYCPRERLKRLKHKVGVRGGSGGTGSKTSSPPPQDAPLPAVGPQLSPSASRANSPLNSLIGLPHIHCMFLSLKILPKHRNHNLSVCAMCT